MQSQGSAIGCLEQHPGILTSSSGAIDNDMTTAMIILLAMGFASNRCRAEEADQLMTPTNEVFLEVGVRFSATTLGEPPPGVFCWVRTVQVRIDLPSRRGELSMRLSRPLALALALIVSPRSAPAQDIAGTVRSYDQAGRTLTLKPDGSKKEIRLLVPQGVSVRGNHAVRRPCRESRPARGGEENLEREIDGSTVAWKEGHGACSIDNSSTFHFASVR